MKKYLSISSLIALSFFIFISCAGPLKMKKSARAVKVTCNPTELEIRGRAIEAEWTATFPAKYFHPKATLKIVPVLVYKGGEVAGDPKILQGAKVLNNYQVVSKNGGAISQKLKFNYVPGMEECRLELRATLLLKKKEYKFDAPYVLAKGAKATALLVDNSGVIEFMKDDYRKHRIVEQEARIKYKVNQSIVSPAELSKEEIKELKSFIDNAIADGNKKQYEGLEISSYASPEGKLERNEQLSKERGYTANKAIEDLYSRKDVKPEGLVEIINTAEDWDGFQTLVASSDIQDKELIIRVLSMYRDPAVREQEIRNMATVFTILKDKILPELRRSVVIAKVKEINYNDQELLAIISSGDIEELDTEALLYGASLLDSNDFATKLKLYRRVAEHFRDERGINNFAAILLEQGRDEEAKEALEMGNIKTPQILNNLGVIALRQGKFDEAKELFKQSNTAVARENIGIVAINQGDYQEAMANLKGTGGLNEALIRILHQDFAGARQILKTYNGNNKSIQSLRDLIK